MAENTDLSLEGIEKIINEIVNEHKKEKRIRIRNLGDVKKAYLKDYAYYQKASDARKIIGDYFDSHDISDKEELRKIINICGKAEAIMLICNEYLEQYRIIEMMFYKRGNGKTDRENIEDEEE
jgi:hypothetical protein